MPEEPQTKVEEVTQTEEQAAEAVANDLDVLVSQITEERDSAKEQLLRTAADFQNFRRRVQSEKEQLRFTAIEGFVADLLPVLDNFERTLQALSTGATLESLLEGVQAVERQMRGALEAHRVTRIPSVGAEFNEELHEAIGHDETDEVADNHVTVEIQPGYRLAEKVIRPARVKVAKNP